jgi:DNA-binding winged helix-turn-helix (wHTH) protein/tetratricopeptide (TPR) repeat protein
MAATLYRFRNFRLDPQARELHLDNRLVSLPVSTLDCLVYLIQHRDRTVGRDELTAAVWGRVDISDVSLSHAIMRLRRLFGDAGNEQNSIRTLPRLGYRWIVEPTIEESIQRAVIHDEPSSETNSTALSENTEGVTRAVRGAAPTAQRTARSRVIGVLFLAFAGILLVVLAVLSNQRSARRPSSTNSVSPRQSAMVLPTQVDAGDEWSWLRFGFMDLIANRLRNGDLPTTPSETVVGLVNARQLDVAGDFHGSLAQEESHAMLIRPHAALVNGLWNVRLEARGDGHDVTAEAQAKDVITAGRAVADDLLVKLGHTPPRSADTDPSVASEELEQRVSAAVLTGQLQVAAALLRDAPEATHSSPQIALSVAALDFFSGDYEACVAHAEALLDQLPAEKNAKLRARVLNRLGAAYFRLGRTDEADKAFAEAIQLLETQNAPDTLATSYTGRGAVAGQSMQLEAASTYLGRARTLHEMSNDTFGVARVDLNLGAVAMDRGLPSVAAPIFEDAAARFQNLATPEALNSALRSLADAQSTLLEHARALATTDRFWPVDTHSNNPREGWWMTLTRAVVLTANGRLHDADELVTQIRTSSDVVKDAVVRVEADVLAANMALLRADNHQAADLAAAAMTPVLQSTNWQDYAGAWLTRIRGLQRSGQVEAAGRQVASFGTWAASTSNGRQRLYALLAQGDQAKAEGNDIVALQRYAGAMENAERQGIPEDVVVVGESYAAALLASGQIDQASAIAGRLAQWGDKDMRAAWVQAAVYNALHKPDASRSALERARQLAGERHLPALP